VHKRTYCIAVVVEELVKKWQTVAVEQLARQLQGYFLNLYSAYEQDFQGLFTPGTWSAGIKNVVVNAGMKPVSIIELRRISRVPEVAGLLEAGR